MMAPALVFWLIDVVGVLVVGVVALESEAALDCDSAAWW
jgi:hypothetical protein